MPEQNWERVADDDPKRCQAIMKNGRQCHNKAMEHSNYCPAHGGNKGEEKAEKQRLRNYKLSLYKDRVAELSESNEITSLKEEVALLRLLIEERLNKVKDNTDLILMSGPLSDLIMKVEKLVTSCHRLDSRLGNLLDKTKILQFAQMIIEIVSKNIDDEETIGRIGDQIFQALGDL